MIYRELLAIKFALEEWRKWLEGAQTPSLVWTDHKKLKFLRTAKRLNPRQARWALFFSRFDFSLTYHPGAKNTKPDALSQKFEPASKDTCPDTILPPQMVVRAIEMDIEKMVRCAQADSAD